MPERQSLDGEDSVYSNPLPPSTHHADSNADDGPQPLTNADFRKLLMTPRAPPVSAQQTQRPAAATREKEEQKNDGRGEERRKKKSFYAKLKKDEEERQKELAEKYRDRAKERRDGQNKDYEQTELVSTTADYRAVAPDAKAGETYAERRKQLIQESKFLGGDMEHTHLVKGLDYALLEKVRAEICNKEQEEMEMEWVASDLKTKEQVAIEKEEEENIQFKTKMARNIHRILFKTRPSERNELFLPKRMAYVVEIDDEFNDTDIPTTLIRSKADCPTLEATTTLSTNDIVIQKLTQILSYLRQGKRDKKAKKKEKAGKPKEEERPKIADDSIYGDLGDYQPDYGSRNKDTKTDRDRRDTRGRNERDHRERERERGSTRDQRDRDRERDRRRDRGGDRDRERGRDRDRGRGERDRGREDDREKKRTYFEKPAEEDDGLGERVPATAKEMVQSINERFSTKQWSNVDLGPEAGFREPEAKPKTKEDERMKKINTKMAVDSYAECYPGMMESADAIDDSDDEVDFMKMDQGNKKGPVGRWDFETQEEYSSYMSQKEALPKAAFQYGLKMADGRKTRRTGPKDDKKELDREWQKIQNIIQKRKQDSHGDDPFAKNAKYD